GFHRCSQDEFLAMVDGYIAHYRFAHAREKTHREALEWATTRGARSGRVAWQYVQDLAGRLGVKLEDKGRKTNDRWNIGDGSTMTRLFLALGLFAITSSVAQAQSYVLRAPTVACGTPTGVGCEGRNVLRPGKYTVTYRTERGICHIVGAHGSGWIRCAP